MCYMKWVFECKEVNISSKEIFLSQLLRRKLKQYLYGFSADTEATA